MHIALPTGGISAFVNKISIMKKCVAMHRRLHTSCIKDNDACLQDGGWSPWSSWSSCSPRQVNSINNHHSHIKANQPSCPSAQVMTMPGCSYQYPRCTHHRRRTCTDPHPSPGGSYCRGRDQVGGEMTFQAGSESTDEPRKSSNCVYLTSLCHL